MELPNLGKHCSEPTCRQLDFLPLKCDACDSIFCREHIAYETHHCTSAYKKDVQVPVCPLCNSPVPGKRGEQPDIVVGAHIDRDCQSDPAKNKRKVFSNKCSVKGCKTKEVVPVTCKECQLNFCLKHRLEADHQCEGRAGAARRRATEAALARQQKSSASGIVSNRQTGRLQQTNNPRATASAIQGSMSEDEALARALALSMAESGQPSRPVQASSSSDQVSSDFMLAQAIAASEQETRTSRSSQNKSCEVS